MTCVYCGVAHSYTADACLERIRRYGKVSNVRVLPDGAITGFTGYPTWECGSCQAQVPSTEISESYYRGQAVCKDCEEVLLEEAGGPPFVLQPGDTVTFTVSDSFDRPKSVRGQHPQLVTMDEVADFPGWDSVYGRDRVFTIDSLDGRPLRATWGTD